MQTYFDKHTPLYMLRGGALYALPSPTNLDVRRWPASQIALAPVNGEQVDPAHPELLYHASVAGVAADFAAHQAAFPMAGGRCYTVTVLRDPLERFVSEFFFVRQFVLSSKWADPAFWRKQFWGARDFDDQLLARLQPPAAEREAYLATQTPAQAAARLEMFAALDTPAHNRHTRLLAGDADASHPVDRAMLAKAKENLAGLAVVGLTEQMPAFFAHLECTFKFGQLLHTFGIPPGFPHRRPYTPGEDIADNVGKSRRRDGWLGLGE